MCWVSKKQDIKIAEQDIPIFKIMDKTNNPKIVSSYFRGHSYELNVLEKTEIKICDGYECNRIIVYIALHSYSDRIQTRRDEYNDVYVFNKKGFCTLPYGSDTIKVKGIIPKGSQYMENERGEFVSNQLILTEICVGLEN